MTSQTPDEDVEDWLSESPVDWSQIISGRVALRVVPRALGPDAPDDWFDVFAMGVLRATAITWILRQTLNFEGALQLSETGASAAADAAFVVRASARAADGHGSLLSTAADAIANATDAARANAYPDFAARAALAAIIDGAKFDGVVDSVERDRGWLAGRSADEPSTKELLSERLARSPLWPADESEGTAERSGQSLAPAWFQNGWNTARTRLERSDETYRVWVNWYESVVLGQRPTFGGTREVEEYVWGRLLAAERQFWNQPAQTINRTILAWIDELELETKLSALVDDLRAARRSAHQTSAESRAHAALVRQLAELSRIEPPAHASIGHNQPPEPVQWQVEVAILSDIQVQASAALELLAAPAPNAAEVGERISIIGTGLKKLSFLTGIAAESAAKAFGKAVGTAVGVALVSMATLYWAGLLNTVLAWLAALA